MSQFSFVASKESGESQAGTLEAPDRDTALEILSSKGLLVIKLDPVKATNGGVLRLGREPRVSGEDLMAFTHELATMLDAGMPLMKCMSILSSDCEDPTFKRVLTDVGAGLSEGIHLPDLLRKYPRIFSGIYVSMVEAGMTVGDLPAILHRLASYIESSETLKQKVQAALIYPVAILGFALVMVTVFLFFGVGMLEDMYASLHAELPLATRILFALVNFASANAYFIVPGAFAAIYASYRLSTTEKGVLFWDGVKLGLPKLGVLFQRIVIARFAFTMSILASAGVPLVHALELVAGSVGNKVVEASLLKSIDRLKAGESFCETLRKTDVFSGMAISMIAVGEESGALDRMLAKLSEFYETQVDIVLKALTGMVEPVVLVGVGVVVGVMIMALGLPMMNLVKVLM